MSVAFCNIAPHMTLLDYAYLATNVYHDPRDLELLGLIPLAIKNITETKFFLDKSGWYQIRTSEVFMNPDDENFYADLYVKIHQGKIRYICIAVRGTKTIDNCFKDYETWKCGSLSESHTLPSPDEYLSKLVDFIMSTERVMHQLEDMNLVDSQAEAYLTGHSLGGALVQLALASFSVTDTVKSAFTQAVSFNPPGISHIKGVHSADDWDTFCMTVRSSYDIVSAIDTPFGFVLNAHVKEYHEEAKQLFPSLKGILKGYAKATCNFTTGTSLDKLNNGFMGAPSVRFSAALAEAYEHFNPRSMDFNSREHYVRSIHSLAQKDRHAALRAVTTDPTAETVAVDRHEMGAQWLIAGKIIKAQHSMANLLKTIAHSHYFPATYPLMMSLANDHGGIGKYENVPEVITYDI